MDLLRQCRQHPRRPLCLSEPCCAGTRTGEPGRADPTPAPSSCLCPTRPRRPADAMAFELKVPCVEGLMRNRYVGRTFIEGTADRGQGQGPAQVHTIARSSQGARASPPRRGQHRSARRRCEPARPRDSRQRRCAGDSPFAWRARRIIAPCFYGIDMSSRDELFRSQIFRPDRWWCLASKPSKRWPKS